MGLGLGLFVEVWIGCSRSDSVGDNLSELLPSQLLFWGPVSSDG